VSPSATCTSMVTGQCSEPAASTDAVVQTSAGTGVQHHANPIVTKNRSCMSILEQLCEELKLDPPTVDVSKSSTSCSATMSVRYGFSSPASCANKADAREEAARVALMSLKVANVVDCAKNYRAQLNEYCQLQPGCSEPKYEVLGSGPFTCTVFMNVAHKSGDLATEAAAKDDAARGVLARLQRTDHILRVIDNARFENFMVCRSPSSAPEFILTARYRFSRPAQGEASKKNAEKVAAQRALSVLYPDLNPKPSLDECKNKLQERNTRELPKYVSVAEDKLFYSEVSVSFEEQRSCDNNVCPLDASDDFAKHALKRLGLVI